MGVPQPGKNTTVEKQKECLSYIDNVFQSEIIIIG